MLAAIIESGEPTRLYTALSLLVSAAAEGEPARGLVSFGALEALIAEDDPADTVFARTLSELRATVRALPDCRLYACAAAVEVTAADRGRIDAALDGVMSTPRFLAETREARLVVV